MPNLIGASNQVNGSAIATTQNLGTTPQGNSTTVQERIAILATQASVNAGAYVVGQYYDGATRAVATSSNALTANQVRVHPVYIGGESNVAIDELGIVVATAGTSGSHAARLAIYTSDANGWPNSKVVDITVSGLDSTGFKSSAVSYTLNHGVRYWFAIHADSNATVRSYADAVLVNLGLSSSTATAYNKCVSRTITYASGLPSTWTFTASDLSGNQPISIRFRVA